MALIDSHCHLNYDYAPKGVEDLLREAREAGVEAFVTIGTELVTMADVQKISETHEDVFHSVGVHPHEAVTLTEGDLSLLERAAAHPKCRAIGEIGLDYHYNHSPKDAQIRALEQQLELAVRVGKPIVVHSREGEEDLLVALRGYVARLAPGRIPGIIHCFTGTVAFGQACLDLGFYFSFSGILTFKKAEEVHEAARRFPLERLLVETDSPYLAPIPHRGKKCEPAMVRFTAMKLAELKGVALDEVARVTTANARRVFGI
ncbi:MAG: TatD family hydrolase [Bdellovibrionota bacterium]